MRAQRALCIDEQRPIIEAQGPLVEEWLPMPPATRGQVMPPAEHRRSAVPPTGGEYPRGMSDPGLGDLCDSDLMAFEVAGADLLMTFVLVGGAKRRLRFTWVTDLVISIDLRATKHGPQLCVWDASCEAKDGLTNRAVIDFAHDGTIEFTFNEVTHES